MYVISLEKPLFKDLVQFFSKFLGGLRIDLAQDRDRWRALVYMVMNLRVP
jgi:hypothetical protein